MLGALEGVPDHPGAGIPIVTGFACAPSLFPPMKSTPKRCTPTGLLNDFGFPICRLAELFLGFAFYQRLTLCY